jgi:hypothetical protein
MASTKPDGKRCQASFLNHTAAHLLTWFVRRWTLAVTCEEARGHLGMETQRQGNDRVIARTTPALLSLYSTMTLTAHLLIEKGATCVRSTVWYGKTRPTFADAIALVRRQLWDHIDFSTSLQETDMRHMLRALFERFMEAVCYAASLDTVELRVCCRKCRTLSPMLRLS